MTSEQVAATAEKWDRRLWRALNDPASGDYYLSQQEARDWLADVDAIRKTVAHLEAEQARLTKALAAAERLRLEDGHAHILEQVQDLNARARLDLLLASVAKVVEEMRYVLEGEIDEWTPSMPLESLQVDLSASQLKHWADTLSALQSAQEP